MPRRAGTLVGAVRADLLGRGFTLVSAPRAFDGGLLVRLGRVRTSLRFDSDRWWKYPELARYACWLESLLAEALPEESAALAALEFRHEPAGFVDRLTERLHADGGYLRAVFAPRGPTTVYWEEDAERPVPAGQTLVMTASDRTRALGVPCTLHRRPAAEVERALVVCSFGPRPEGPRPPNVCRRVAGMRGRRMS
jgi:hypothetical protein